MNKYIVLIALAVAPLALAAEVSSTEQQVVLAANKRSQEIALARLPIETRYLTTLNQFYKKAEAAKDLDLQVKIKKEIEIVEKNIAYFKEKSTEETSSKGFHNIKFIAENGITIILNDNTKKNNAGESYRQEGNKIIVKSKISGKDWPMELAEDCSYIKTTQDGITYYRNGVKPKGEPKKAPEGEEVNTLFGRRVK